MLPNREQKAMIVQPAVEVLCILILVQSCVWEKVLYFMDQPSGLLSARIYHLACILKLDFFGNDGSSVCLGMTVISFTK